MCLVGYVLKCEIEFAYLTVRESLLSVQTILVPLSAGAVRRTRSSRGEAPRGKSRAARVGVLGSGRGWSVHVNAVAGAQQAHHNVSSLIGDRLVRRSGTRPAKLRDPSHLLIKGAHKLLCNTGTQVLDDINRQRGKQKEACRHNVVHAQVVETYRKVSKKVRLNIGHIAISSARLTKLVKTSLKIPREVLIGIEIGALAGVFTARLHRSVFLRLTSSIAYSIISKRGVALVTWLPMIPYGTQNPYECLHEERRIDS